MKTTVKAAVAVIFAVLAAVLFRYMYLVSTGRDETSVKTEAFKEYMIESKEMFLEKSIPIQKAVFSLSVMNRFSLLSGRDGTVFVETKNGPVPLENLTTRQSAEFIGRIMNGYAVGGRVYNIEITQEGVLFFTKYDEAGCTGFFMKGF
jgi:hypothetical protein